MRIIAHLDMDAFFAAIEERDNPRFQGMPVAVGADPRGGKGRGVVATANYKARAYGLHSALPISWAWRLSEQARRRGQPPVVFIAPDFEKYVRSSRSIASIVQTRVPVIEKAGLDELYMDLSFAGSYEAAEALAREIKREIREKERLTASIGIGPNKLIAKIASDVRKPDGLTVVREEEAEAFLGPMSVRKLPGIGPKTEASLKDKKIMTVRDLKALTQAELQGLFGKWGLGIHAMARGLDDSPVEESGEVKSIGEQETFLVDTLETELLGSRLREMASHVFQRMSEEGFGSFRTVVLTVRFADFETRTKSRTAKVPMTALDELLASGLGLLLPFLDSRLNPKLKKIRLLGLRIEKLGAAASDLVLT